MGYLSFLCGIQVLTDVNATSTVFCYMTPCRSVEIYGCFERISCLFFQKTRSARNACKFLLFYDICLYSRPGVAVSCNCEFWPLSMYNISLKSTGPFRHRWLKDFLCLQIHVALMSLTFGLYCHMWCRS